MNTTIFSENLLTTKKLAKQNIIVDAIYSDETSNFQNPAQFKSGESIDFLLRVFKDNFLNDSVNLHIGDDSYPMFLMKSESQIFDFYKINLKIDKYTSYYFSIKKDETTYFYNKQGVVNTINPVYNFKAIPDFFVPDWLQGAVMYHIFVDRFNNSDISNNVLTKEYSYLGTMSKQQEDWYAPVTDKDFCTFYGGDLQGILDKIDYLKDLGIEVIYLSPVFVSPSNHKYDISDYDHIDPHLTIITKDGGDRLNRANTSNDKASMYIKRTTDPVNLKASNEFFVDFVKQCHDNNIKVIMDGVFNHCGSFHRWLNKEGVYKEKGAYQDKNSPYVPYFKWYGEDWPNNIAYDGWWGHSNHPKLNFENSQELYDYILGIGKKWVSEPYNIDGWRLDVAADLGFSQDFNHQFWRDFRKSVKEGNPSAVILGEHYGDCEAWLAGDQWDTIMNYDAFMEPITWFLTGMQKHSEEFKPEAINNTLFFEEAMRYNRARMSYHSLYTSMNQLSNHDHSRFLTRTNMQVGRLHNRPASDADHGVNKGILYEAVVFQMTWPGAPTLYYGDEAGVTGWSDPDNRRSYPWGREDKTIIDVHKAAIALRRDYPVLKNGSVEYLHNEHGFLSYGRWNEKEKVAVIINNNKDHRIINIPVWKMDILSGSIDRVMYTNQDGYSVKKEGLNVKDGYVNLYVGPYSAVVLAKK